MRQKAAGNKEGCRSNPASTPNRHAASAPAVTATGVNKSPKSDQACLYLIWEIASQPVDRHHLTESRPSHFHRIRPLVSQFVLLR